MRPIAGPVVPRSLPQPLASPGEAPQALKPRRRPGRPCKPSSLAPGGRPSPRGRNPAPAGPRADGGPGMRAEASSRPVAVRCRIRTARQSPAVAALLSNTVALPHVCRCGTHPSASTSAVGRLFEPKAQTLGST